MNKFQIELDKYLTREPDDYRFDSYVDKVIETLDEDFYYINEDWCMAYDGQCNNWLNSCYEKDINPDKAAKLIERAFRRYIDPML